MDAILDLMEEYYLDHLDVLHKESFTSDMISEIKQLLELLDLQIDDEEFSNALVSFPCGRISYICPPMENAEERIDILRKKPQPVQRTQEWYEYRKGLITASNAYKALGSDAKRRELVKQMNTPYVPRDHVCTDGPMHWGVRYEPVSIQYYEHVNDTIVEEFGCITHDVYKLGASPDGINVKPGPLYGRMLEIKNPFTREITGNPKEEYWVQCQFQMEVCNLDACDFLETKFVEYESEDAFMADGTFSRTADGKYKGIILQFLTTEVVYEYMPFQCSEEEYKVWEQRQMNERSWIKTIYWKLECESCVLILRQPKWFSLVVDKFTLSE